MYTSSEIYLTLWIILCNDLTHWSLDTMLWVSLPGDWLQNCVQPGCAQWWEIWRKDTLQICRASVILIRMFP